MHLENLNINSWEDIAASKRRDRDSHLIKEWLIPESDLPEADNVTGFPQKVLSARELEITETNAPELASLLATGEWSSYEVTKAFCHRSQVAHQLTNCLSEVFYTEALERAKDLDDHLARSGKPIGRFHGMPIGLKDNINVMGQASTVGFVAWCFDPEGGATEESAIAKLLRKEGAVFYCKTNVPVAMMMAESTNHIYGYTTNPVNRKLSSGGSSGGCAAHAALRGAVVEIGSDIGGSIRIPASFQGLYSLRPTSGRYPTYGTRSGLPGLESVSSVNGPLTTSLETMEWYLQNMVNSNPSLYDPKTFYMPWTPAKLPSKLKIAVCADDQIVRPTPPVRRAVEKVKHALEAAGHEVVDWNPKTAHHQELADLITAFFLSDGGSHVLNVTNKVGEPLFPAMASYGSSKSIDVSELWDLHAKRTGCASDWLKQWVALGIDCLVMPVTPHAACPHHKFGRWVGYTSVVNAVDVSSGTFPVTAVDAAVDKVDVNYQPRNDADKAIYESYDPALAHGAPVSLQVIGRKYEDEKIVELIRHFKSIL